MNIFSLLGLTHAFMKSPLFDVPAFQTGHH